MNEEKHVEIVLKGHMQNMLNNCFRCHKQPYETDPTHWHYCNDCVKVCTACKELKVLWAFNFDFKSAEWKRWHESKGYGFMNASGHLDVCGQCERDALEAIKPKFSDEQLRLMMNATLRKPATTEPPGTDEVGVQRQLDL